jgi:integrase
MTKPGAGVAGAVPKTLAELLDEFFRVHASEKLAGKTTERYRDYAKYLSADLLAMPISDITPLHLNREWTRLLKSGGHTRATKTRPSQPRAMSAKTVRNMAGLVSSAFSRAIRWGMVTHNPVKNSEPPIPKKRPKVALTVVEQDTLIGAATGFWCMAPFIEVAAALGARRGEVLALRWSDLVGGRATISRSLSQTKAGLEFKGTKSERPRTVSLTAEALAALEAHRKRQDEFRAQFGSGYRDLGLVFASPTEIRCGRIRFPRRFPCSAVD